MAPLTGWIDYDRQKLNSLDAKGRIDYFEKRVRMVAITPLRRIVQKEIHPVNEKGQSLQDCSALLIYAVAVCCTIESLGRFLNPGTPYNSDRFKAFLHKYMNKAFQSKALNGVPYGQILWKSFRNGLAHGFAVSHGGFEGIRGDPYFAVKGSILEINPSCLQDDLEQGFAGYLSDLRKTSGTGALFGNCDKVFTDVFIKGK